MKKIITFLSSPYSREFENIWGAFAENNREMFSEIRRSDKSLFFANDEWIISIFDGQADDYSDEEGWRYENIREEVEKLIDLYKENNAEFAVLLHSDAEDELLQLEEALETYTQLKCEIYSAGWGDLWDYVALFNCNLEEQGVLILLQNLWNRISRGASANNSENMPSDRLYAFRHSCAKTKRLIFEKAELCLKRYPEDLTCPLLEIITKRLKKSKQLYYDYNIPGEALKIGIFNFHHILDFLAEGEQLAYRFRDHQLSLDDKIQCGFDCANKIQKILDLFAVNKGD